MEANLNGENQSSPLPKKETREKRERALKAFEVHVEWCHDCHSPHEVRYCDVGTDLAIKYALTLTPKKRLQPSSNPCPVHFTR